MFPADDPHSPFPWLLSPLYACTATPTATPAAMNTPTPNATPTTAPAPTSTPTPVPSGGRVCPPSNLTAPVGQSGHITLQWAASPTSGVTCRVDRGASSGGESLFRSGISGASFTDTGVNRFRPYWYRVCAVSASGSESARSNEAVGFAF